MRILYVEDNPFDADLTRRELRRTAPDLQLDIVDTLADAQKHLEVSPLAYSAVLLDLRLPDGDGLVLLNAIRHMELPLVVIILTGAGDEETAVSSLKAGADDYVIKQDDYLSQLPQMLENALQRFQTGQRTRGRRLRVLYAEIHPQDIELTQRHLSSHAAYIQLEVVQSDSEALTRLKAPDAAKKYDVLLLDYGLGRLNALDLVKQISLHGKPILPVVMVTGQGNEEVALQALKLGAADYLVKTPGYLYRLPSVLENAFHMAELERNQQVLQESQRQISEAYEKTIESWARAIELRDRETGEHSTHVAELTVRLAERLGFSPEEQVHLRRGALLHDIGKLGVPDAILLKPGSLTEEEWTIMRMHPVYAYQFLYTVEFLRPAIDIPYQHHERWDGSGYPHGLKGEEIPLAARIFAVVDVWDALCSNRSFRPAWERSRIFEFLRSQAGIKFDAAIVEAFLKMVEAE